MEAWLLGKARTSHRYFRFSAYNIFHLSIDVNGNYQKYNLDSEHKKNELFSIVGSYLWTKNAEKYRLYITQTHLYWHHGAYVEIYLKNEIHYSNIFCLLLNISGAIQTSWRRISISRVDKFLKMRHCHNRKSAVQNMFRSNSHFLKTYLIRISARIIHSMFENSGTKMIKLIFFARNLENNV